MEFIDTKYFSELQKKIILQKTNGIAYCDISLSYKVTNKNESNLSHDAIKTCIKRSSLSLRWDKGEISGKLPTISPVDVDLLKDYIIDNALHGEYIDVEDTVDEAERLRTDRIANARKFLIQIKCFKILEEVVFYSMRQEPARTWVYQHIDDLESELYTPRNIETNRLIACTPEKIIKFADIFYQVLQGYDPPLIFGADETTLQPNTKKKIIIPNFTQDQLMPDLTKLNLNHSGQLREFCVKAALYSWDTKANIKSCANASKMTSTYPFNKDVLIHNKFVGELPASISKLIDKKLKKNRKVAININSKLISDENFLNELNAYIKTTAKHSHLHFDGYSGDYVKSIVDLCKLTNNDCFFLSTIPNFIDQDLQVHFFD